MKSGFALIAVTIITALVATIGASLISVATTDTSISTSHQASSQAYYLSQAGVGELIALIRNDFNLYTRLVEGTLTQANSQITRVSVLNTTGGYTAYAVSTAPGAATIFATGTSPTAQGLATRSVRVGIGTATGSSTRFPYVMLTGGAGSRESGNATISRVTVNVAEADLQTNQIFRIRNHGSVSVSNGDLRAQQVNVQPGSTLTFQNGQIRERAQSVPMPRIDFDSSATSSWKNRATILLTVAQFDALPNNSTLEGIIFVDGTPEDLKKNLTVRGTLVINGSFELKNPGSLTIMPRPPVSGLLVKNTLELESAASIRGLVYAGHWLEIENDDNDSPAHLQVDIVGAVVGWNLMFSGRSDPQTSTTINITYSRHLASAPLDPDLNVNSPLIAINHWEEVY